MLSPHTIASIGDHAVRFASAKPFRHVVMDGFLSVAHADAILAQFPPFGSGDARSENGTVGNKSTIERIRGLGDAFAALDDAIKSPAFLGAVERITGIRDLIYDPWYFGGGTHESRDQQDLDAHVDFNRHPIRHWHRRLNLIVYFNHEWHDEWGGSLRLHSNPRSIDDSIVTITPTFNRAVLFETTETSWHSFPQIELPPEKSALTRKSIALYFYSENRPDHELAATHSTIYVDRPLPETFAEHHTLSAGDVQTLRILLARRDQHIERLYGEISGFGAQLENAKHALAEAQRRLVVAPPAPSSADTAPSPVNAAVAPAPALRALARRLPERVKRPLRRWWHG